MTAPAAPPPSPDPSAVAVIGTGALGGAVARALLAAGHPTTVWNRTPARADALVAAGATRAATPADAAAAAPLVLVALPADGEVRAVLGPVADAGALAGRTIVNLTSGTPDQARDLAALAAAAGAAHLDAAAMSGTRLVGDPSAVFLYAGPAEAFAAARPALDALGRAVHLGADPGVASLYDTALLGLNLGVLLGFHQAVALVGAAGVPAAEVAAVATGYLPFVTGLLADHAAQVDAGAYPPDDGTLEVYAGALDHLAATGRAHGVAPVLADALGPLVAEAIARGHGGDGLARLADVMARPPAGAPGAGATRPPRPGPGG
jgi:3-hydroxyisobutyrate dehydrogenase-like beta-hydroxyacid dehydrogenase